MEHYTAVYFLDDFRDLLGDDFPTEYYGMIDQLVCSRSEHFVGMRGYHSQKRTPKPTQKTKSKEAAASVASEEKKNRVSSKVGSTVLRTGSTSTSGTEYALAWRNIDYDVDPILREAIDKDTAIVETLSINEKKVAGGMGVVVEQGG